MEEFIVYFSEYFFCVGNAPRKNEVVNADSLEDAFQRIRGKYDHNIEIFEKISKRISIINSSNLIRSLYL